MEAVVEVGFTEGVDDSSVDDVGGEAEYESEGVDRETMEEGEGDVELRWCSPRISIISYVGTCLDA